MPRRREPLTGGGIGRRMAAVLAVVAVAFTGLGTAPAAVAAGSGVLSVSITPVHPLTGVTITQTQYNAEPDANGIAYRVAYSCSVADCTNATVQFSPSQPDPYGLAAQTPAAYGPTTLLAYKTWTRPNGVPESTPTGDDATGKTFHLGNLAAGASGTFLATWGILETGTYTTARAAQFYPDGFQVEMSATIDSDSAVAPVAAVAAPVTWRIGTPEPGLSVAIPDVIKPDQTFTATGYMSSGAFTRRGSGAIVGTSAWIGAGNYTVTMTLPAEAEVAGTIGGGGVYDAGTHAITWTSGTEAAPEYYAAGGWGWGSGFGWVNRNEYYGRQVPLTFPAEKFAEADANGCNFEKPLSISMDTSVTYLDGERTTKTASTEPIITVACWDPFASSDLAKNSSGNAFDGGTRLLNVPDAGAADSVFNWQVTAYNGGNVPAVAVIEDGLDHADLPVYRIDLSLNSDVEWTLNTGETGTTTATRRVNAPAGTWFTHAKVTSTSIAPARIRPDDTGRAPFTADYYYKVSSDAPIGEQRTNSATSTMSWPGYDQFAPETKTADRTVQFRKTPGATPRIIADFPNDAVVEGGGQAVPGRNVTFSVGGLTRDVPEDSTFTPEYMFIAPVGWEVLADSAAFAAAVPAGVTFTYATKTVDSAERDVVVATWPAGTSFADLATLPTMTVIATPTFAVAAGTASQAEARIGDSARNWDNVEARYDGAKQNTGDIDGSGDLEAWFSTINQTVNVSSTSALSVIKEICQPDADAADGCDWVSDSTNPVQVPTDADNIEYRVTLQNLGNIPLNDVVAYDVLPYVGDTGLIPATANTPRGSTFNEVLDSVSEVSGNVTLSYSASTNPSRPEVHPTSGGVDDWAADPAGKQALRAEVPVLAPGESATFQYSASVGAGAETDALACNSVAAVSDKTLASEPTPVCATTAEADLEATGPATIPAQLDRPVVFPFTFENNGGSQRAVADVTIEVPAGVTVTDLAAAGWTCTSEDGDVPLEGPTTLTCVPDSELEKDVPVALNLSTIVTQTGVAVTARIDGSVTDTDPENNAHTITADVAEAVQGVGLVKTNELSGLVPGQETTYTITATNPLRTEALPGATIVDTIPAGLQFVSASDDGAFADGTVTWSLEEIPANGSTSVAVTVLVLEEAAGDIRNTADVSAPDPVFPDQVFTGTASDVDAVNSLTLSKIATVTNPEAPMPGDVVTFVFTATNTGTGALSALELTDAMPGISAITVDSWPTLPGYLGVNEAITAHAEYTLTQADVNSGKVNNTAAATAETVDGEAVAASASVDVPLPSAAALSLAKEGVIDVEGAPRAGDEITYSFVVMNTGNVTVGAISLVDEMSGLSAISFGEWPGVEGELGAGQSVTATAQYALTQADIDGGQVDNTAKVSGTDPSGEVVGAVANASVAPSAAPELTVVKTGTLEDVEVVEAGNVITYEFEVRNTGNVTITDVVLQDPLDGLSAITYGTWVGEEGILAPDEVVQATATLILAQEHVDAGTVENVATASGTPTRGNLAAAEGSDTVTIDAAPSLVIVKSSELTDGNGDDLANPGEKIVYSFEVSNTGNVTLSDVTVQDEMVTGVPMIESLAPGESVVVAAGEYTVTTEDAAAGEVLNIAAVTGVTPAGEEVSSESNPVRTSSGEVPDGSGLATTGVDVSVPLMVGGTLLLAGIAVLLLLAARRRGKAATSTD